MTNEKTKHLCFESVRQFLMMIQNFVRDDCPGTHKCWECPYHIEKDDNGTICVCLINAAEQVIENIMDTSEWQKEFPPKPERNEP